MAEKIPRTRNYVSLVYPESAPSDWIQILRDHHIGALVSPLHEFDVNEKTGELKKPHYHVILIFDSVKTQAQAQRVFDTFNDGVLCQPVLDLTSYARYLVHMDDPEKHRYSLDDVIQIGGVNYCDIIERVGERYELIHEIEVFCREENIVSYAKLCDLAYEQNLQWYKLICDSSSIHFVNYLRSLMWEVNNP